MTTSTSVGRSTGSKPINLQQLQNELETAGVDCSTGLGLTDPYVHIYDAEGQVTDFPESDQPTVDQSITDHVAMRLKTDAEYAEEFQNPATTPERKQEIRDITAGLLPREQLPITQEEWDQRMGGV